MIRGACHPCVALLCGSDSDRLALAVLNCVPLSLSAQPASPGARSLPTFEVDAAWPKMLPRWKVGDPSSFAIDGQDRAWLLNRPRPLVKPEDAAMATPPVLVFDTAGTLVTSWGGAGAGYEWPHREHGIHVDAGGSVSLWRLSRSPFVAENAKVSGVQGSLSSQGPHLNGESRIVLPRPKE